MFANVVLFGLFARGLALFAPFARTLGVRHVLAVFPARDYIAINQSLSAHCYDNGFNLCCAKAKRLFGHVGVIGRD